MAKPENWTGVEYPCFVEYSADPMSMTKEEFIGEADNIMECDFIDDCPFKTVFGHNWYECPEGAKSKHCDWLPKEGKDE